MTVRQEVGDWMYTGKRGRVRHWCPSKLTTGYRRFAVCTVVCLYGTGSQSEYEHAASLSPCLSCLQRGAPR